MRLLILASESKRRVEILRMMGFRFLVIPSRIEEDHGGDAVLTARRLSYRKALKVWKEYKYAVVLGADTVVVVGDRLLGKPEDEKSAFDMLKTLSGRWHKVITAVSVISSGFRKTFHDVAWVKFRNLTDTEIWDYIKTEEPMDKAGAYAVQGLGAVFIERIRGDFYTVMGLPASRTYRVLRDVLD